MQGKEILTMVDVLANERGLEKEQVFKALETALATAARRDFGRYQLKAYIDRKTGNYQINRVWEVVDDNEPEFDESVHLYDDQAEEKFGKSYQVGDTAEEFLSEEPLGRQAAQVFRQNIRENLKRAEKSENEKVYKKHVGEIYLVVVKRFIKGDVLVAVNDHIEGIIPKDNIIPGERFRIDQKVNAILYDVVDNYKGQQLIFDRASPDFVKGMMKKEITEVGNENVLVRSVARRPGVKSLVMVESVAPYVEALRECIGPKGMRIRYVSENMNNEPINLVEASKEEGETYYNMLSPIEPQSIYIDEEQRQVDIALAEEDLEKAQGRTGLNVELMSELVGMTVNLMSEQDFEDKHNSQAEALINMFQQNLQVDDDLAEVLVELGFEDITSVAYAPAHVFNEVEGMDSDLVEELQNQAKNVLETQGEATISSELKSISALEEAQIALLEQAGISNKDDLADLSVWELLDIVEMDENKASDVIMEARKDWF